ncbi:carbon-nitrogen hydrolase family protein [Alicyclobacillus sp.]|uniref:carbon-nitrogen hydrolase family protein n=1 Tax=Alicyclobacillus sp. TaxID=61169 RepID=UPI0025C1EE44|nr:carbon-nitrogen hydrolase family protein [Alicyclobacillus sp.]MCL6516729.1 carbon-nitrogen hydrolase family protein [Alicyclobacillus sp.]
MRLRLSLVQDAPVQGDIQATLTQMGAYAARAGRKGIGADLLVFPELYVTGYFPNLWERRPTPADELDWIDRVQKMARDEGLWIVFGHPSYRAQTLEYGRTRYGRDIPGDGIHLPLYNSVSLVSPAGLRETYAKVHLYGSERDCFTPGDLFPVWDTPWGKVGVQICFDVEFPEGPRLAALGGAKLLLFPASNPAPYGEWHGIYTAARGLENRVFAATVNRLGAELTYSFCGGSCVIHPKGAWLVPPSERPGLYSCDIDFSELEQIDPSIDYLRLRRPDLYQGLDRAM